MMSQLSLDRSSADALLFDLDGTIVDNMRFHQQAWQELIVEMGYNWSLAEVKANVWGKNEEIFERLFPGRYGAQEVAQLSTRKEQRYIDLYRPHIKMIEGLETLLVRAKECNFTMAIATAAPKICVDFVCSELQLDRFFELVVHADQVRLSKPHPETFLTCASALTVEPHRCIVFEDAPVGVRAADAAGMRSVVVLSTHEKEEFSTFEGIQGYISDYSNVSIS